MNNIYYRPDSSSNYPTVNSLSSDSRWIERLDFRAHSDQFDNKQKLLMAKGETPLFIVTRKNFPGFSRFDVRLKKVKQLVQKALVNFEPFGREYLLCSVSGKYFIQADHLDSGELMSIFVDLLNIASNATEEQKKVLALLLVAGMNRMVELDKHVVNSIPYGDALNFVQDLSMQHLTSNSTHNVRPVSENVFDRSISTLYSQKVNSNYNWLIESGWRAREDDRENKTFKGETTLFSFMRKRDAFESDVLLSLHGSEAIKRIQLALESFDNGGKEYLLCRVNNCLFVEAKDVESEIINKILPKLKELCIAQTDLRKLEALIEITEGCINSLAARDIKYKRSLYKADLEYVARLKNVISTVPQQTSHAHWIMENQWPKMTEGNFPLSQRYTSTLMPPDSPPLTTRGETYLFPLVRGQIPGYLDARLIARKTEEIIQQALKHFYINGRDVLLCRNGDRIFIQTAESLEVVCHLLTLLSEICIKEQDINKAYALAIIMEEGLKYIKPNFQNLMKTEFWRLPSRISELVLEIRCKWEEEKNHYGYEKISSDLASSWIRVLNGFGKETSNGSSNTQSNSLDSVGHFPMAQPFRVPVIRQETVYEQSSLNGLTARNSEGETILFTLNPSQFLDSKSYLSEFAHWITCALDNFEQGGKEFLLNSVKGTYFIQDPRIESGVAYSLLNLLAKKADKETRQHVMPALALLLKAGVDRLFPGGNYKFVRSLYNIDRFFEYLPEVQRQVYQNPAVDDRSQEVRAALSRPKHLNHVISSDTDTKEKEVEESASTTKAHLPQAETSEGVRNVYTKRRRDDIDQAYFGEGTFGPWEKQNRKIAIKKAVSAGMELINKLSPEYYDSSLSYRYAINIGDLAKHVGETEANEFLDKREQNRNLKAPIGGLREVTGDLLEMESHERKKSIESSNAAQILEQVLKQLTIYAKKKKVNITENPTQAIPVPRNRRKVRPGLGTAQGDWTVIGGKRKPSEYKTQEQDIGASDQPQPALAEYPSPAKKQRIANQVPEYKSEQIRQSTSDFIKDLNKMSLKELMAESKNSRNSDQMRDLAAVIFRKYKLNSKKRLGEDKKTMDEARIYLKNQGFNV